MRRRSLWRRVRRTTRGPRNALLARGIAGAGRALGALPVPVALALGDMLGRVAHAVLVDARRLAVGNVGVAFPELPLRERRRLVRRTFRHAGRSFVELALFRKLRGRAGYVVIEGLDILDRALAGGRGAIAVTGHVGNWELLAATIADQGYPLSVVARRVNDARFQEMIASFRGDVGIEILLRDAPNFVRDVRSSLARGRIVALLIDQDTRGAGVVVPFFGRPARTPPGAAVLALRLRAPLVTVFIERRLEGGHRIRFEAMDGCQRGPARATELTARLTSRIEAQIRRAPVEWVWWHERWRRADEHANPTRV